MTKMRLTLLLVATAVTGVIAVGARVSDARASGSDYEPVLDPANFVAVIDNPYFPLPVGRTLVYEGIKEGQTQVDTVTVTDQTKVIEGITARAVSDISTHDGASKRRSIGTRRTSRAMSGIWARTRPLTSRTGRPTRPGPGR